MIKIFLDTNVWLRHLAHDNPKQSPESTQLIKHIAGSNFSTYTSTFVLMEVNYTLVKHYRHPQSSVARDLLKITDTTNLTIIEKTSFKKALALHLKTHIKLSDCLIATQLPEKATLITFDTDFSHIPDLNPQTPGEFLAAHPQLP